MKTKDKNLYDIKRKFLKYKRDLKRQVAQKDEAIQRLYTEQTKTKKAIKVELFGDKSKQKDTKIELFVKDFLNEKNIKYTEQKRIRYLNYDFYLPEYNILIECDGDYFHCNDLLYEKPKNELQRKNILKNEKKIEFAKEANIPLIKVWELSIKKDPDGTIQRLDDIIKLLSNKNSFELMEINYVPKKT